MGEVNRIDDALKCYDKVIEIEKNSFDAWENKGTLLRIKIRKILAGISPYELPQTIGTILQLFDEAESSYDRAVESRPNDAVCHFKRFVLFIERSIFDDKSKEFFLNKGLNELKIAIEADPKFKEIANKEDVSKFIVDNPKFQSIVG